ncbi:DUF1579 domain-containing protein [Mangrovimonas sp. CR14]|uniref:DUF1579 domain-containing protein n=1 Tax=Mangrovimonas sp. CR14 TaxID=2706120 RepID=UPI0014218FA5|nr:DUF1579 domain-containing protein [Mangrovimonas sp. CR14]NIK93426.1 DUF1579 domain-containing protein [Mangrovimonas sp. CR14]
MRNPLFLMIALFISFSSFSQSPEEMKAWESYMTPGEEHKWLASMNGQWTATVKQWMDPSKPPVESKATTENRMLMNGLYQESSHRGNMMNMAFEGRSITGFDNSKKMFVSTWIDNFGSGIMVMEGIFVEPYRVLVLEGTMVDPTTGKDLKVKEVMTFVSKNSYKFEMYMDMGGAQIKTMEINYTREK